MEPLPREASAADPHRPVIPGSESLSRARCVAVVFKERRYDDGRHKTWFFTNIHHVAVVHGRLQLIREGYGLVFDVPYEEVEQVYTANQETPEHTPES
jgi:hypothetical protein